jgi:hypothetical protein
VSGSTVVRGAGALIDGKVAAYLWPIMRQALDAHARRNGGGILPDAEVALNDLREAASLYLAHRPLKVRPDGPKVPTSADKPARCPCTRDGDLTSAQVADRLGITARHVPRLAERAGVEPLPGRLRRWAPDAVAAMAEHRRTA